MTIDKNKHITLLFLICTVVFSGSVQADGTAVSSVGTSESVPPAGPASSASAVATIGSDAAVSRPALSGATAVEDIKKLEFILLVVEPVMRLNEAVYRDRCEVERISNKVNVEKKELTVSEAEWLMRTKARYQLGATDSLDSLLQRVDGVKMAFLVAPLALVVSWNNPQTDLKRLLGNRMEALNVAPGDENVRFRKARAKAPSLNEPIDSVTLMRAYLGIETDAQANGDPWIATVKEINRLSNDPAVEAKIRQVYTEMLSQK